MSFTSRYNKKLSDLRDVEREVRLRRQKLVRDDRAARGLCISCSKPNAGPLKTCEFCRKRNKENSLKRLEEMIEMEKGVRTYPRAPKADVESMSVTEMLRAIARKEL